MKIGILSDSHDHSSNVDCAVRLFNELGVDYVLHAGDMVAAFTAEAFGRLDEIRFIAVFGNCDGDKVLLRDVITTFGGEVYPESFNGVIGGKRIFMKHRPEGIEELAESGKFDLIVYGHTHLKEVHRVNGTLILNPGETTDWRTGTSTVMIVDLDTMDVQEVPLQ